MNWRYAFTSVIGTSHRETGLPCQDASYCELIHTTQGEVLLAVASDGAGSAAFAEEGAQMCVALLAEQVELYFSQGKVIQDISVQQVQEWLLLILSQMIAYASVRENKLRDYACTLLATIVGSDYVVFFQLGDGCIVIDDAEKTDSYASVFWPDKGMYANTTYFITDTEALQHLQFAALEKEVRSIAVFTDGIESLALQYASQEVFAPFFRGLFPAMLSENFDQDTFTTQLSGFLDSGRLNERTNDDKTLILAARKAPILC